MHLLCFGDSNTYGYDPRSYLGGRYPAQIRWPERMAAVIGCTVCNAGENGRTIPRSDWELGLFDRLLAAEQPDTLLVMLGSNDLLMGVAPQTVCDRMEAFLQRLLPMGIVLLAPPLPVLGEWVPDASLIQRAAQLSSLYRELALRLGIRFADADEWGVALSFDGVHFTEEGHRAFANGVCAVLRAEKNT